jgi:hypothetical protein
MIVGVSNAKTACQISLTVDIVMPLNERYGSVINDLVEHSENPRTFVWSLILHAHGETMMRWQRDRRAGASLFATVLVHLPHSFTSTAAAAVDAARACGDPAEANKRNLFRFSGRYRCW